MSVTLDFDCCANKCLTISRCDGPWCIQATKCPPCATDNCTPLTGASSTTHHGGELSISKTTKCCGTLRCGDELTLTSTASTTVYTVRHVGNGFILATEVGGETIRLEGYNGALVHVKFYGSFDKAVDGLEQHVEQRYHVHRRCATGSCSTQISSCSTDPACAPCPC